MAKLLVLLIVGLALGACGAAPCDDSCQWRRTMLGAALLSNPNFNRPPQAQFVPMAIPQVPAY